MSSGLQADIDRVDRQYNEALTLRNLVIDKLKEQDTKFKREYHDIRDENHDIRDKIYSADSDIEKLKSELSYLNNSIAGKKHELEEIARDKKAEDEAKVFIEL